MRWTDPNPSAASSPRNTISLTQTQLHRPISRILRKTVPSPWNGVLRVIFYLLGYLVYHPGRILGRKLASSDCLALGDDNAVEGDHKLHKVPIIGHALSPSDCLAAVETSYSLR